MPPLVAAVAAAATWVVANPWTAMMLFSTLASAGYSAYMMASMKASPTQETSDRLQTIRSSVQPHRIIYGEIMTSGPLIYAHSWSKNNRYLALVVALAGHECEEIGEVWLNDKLSTDPYFDESASISESHTVPANGVVTLEPSFFDAFEITVTQSTSEGTVTVDPALYTKNSNTLTFDASVRGQSVEISFRLKHVVVHRHLGSPDQVAAPELIAYSGGEWTEAHRLRGIAYIVVRLRWNTDVFPTGLPNIKARVKGRKVYDPRTGVTAWSDNWALCMADYLTSTSGLNVPREEIHLPTWIAAANICDEEVPLA